MADEMVRGVQKWLNEEYRGRKGYTVISEDGATGGTTVGALIVALQIELGIPSPVPTFGPATERAFPGLTIQAEDAEPNNLNKILQAAFYCKGYNPGGLSGKFYIATAAAVNKFERDVGLEPTTLVDSKLMKAILNTDGFVKHRDGRSNVRTIQQTLNAEYSNYFDYIPTNGIYERKTNQAIIYALQHEEGIGHIANGNFGPSTVANCPTLHPGNGATKLNRILQWALACNSDLFDTSPYNGNYNANVEIAVRAYQNFMTLPDNGVADMPTIKQLLTSNGYEGRSAIACDASTVINSMTASLLKNHGYQVIGRYLTGNVGGDGGLRSKAMTHEELAILQENGIRVFPIYQDGGYYSDYFVPGKGTDDAWKAVRAAYKLGFPTGTTIYFAVDFDAYDFEVTNKILPYLAEVRSVLNTVKSSPLPDYKLGVYGSRNTCIRAQGASNVEADYSFVGNMSTGFSGNLGFPMPGNWAFSQFVEVNIGVGGDIVLGIDKNDYSGLDQGVAAVNPPDNPRDTELYEALHAAFVRMGQNMPGLQHFAPELFVTSFDMSKSYELFRISGIFTGSVEFSSSLELPSEGEKVATISISPEGISGSLESILGESYGKLSDRIFDYENMIDDMSASISAGAIQFSIKGSGANAELRITCFNEDIPLESGGNVSLGVTMVFKTETNLNASWNEFSTPEAQSAAALLGILFIVGLIALYGVPAFAAAATVTAIIALIKGDQNDIT
ncbi:glycoside hydrolase domain-containing protein [Oceanobacillus neutriphilus]|uniref:DUF1906 domain-containing protein n=1 Tax=Oceanobacillus neutriphilus TaxID=531815 RepID=A0ABQ2NR27_9BACI|nr:glycoside hydrolase domain-containing protein [Oceanobacillus neutriphilus]GGP07881.1 hypothetical protein GCM10011346_05900 [Oceanobacillus neutriphilus]